MAMVQHGCLHFCVKQTSQRLVYFLSIFACILYIKKNTQCNPQLCDPNLWHSITFYFESEGCSLFLTYAVQSWMWFVEGFLMVWVCVCFCVCQYLFVKLPPCLQTMQLMRSCIFRNHCVHIFSFHLQMMHLFIKDDTVKAYDVGDACIGISMGEEREMVFSAWDTLLCVLHCVCVCTHVHVHIGVCKAL